MLSQHALVHDPEKLPHAMRDGSRFSEKTMHNKILGRQSIQSEAIGALGGARRRRYQGT
jgi:hypothetical protein